MSTPTGVQPPVSAACDAGFIRPHAFAVVVALSVLALAATPAHASHEPGHVLPAFGVGTLRAETFADYPLGLDDLERMGQARIGLYRARFRQDQVIVDGSFSNWSRLDNLARTAALDGVALQPVLINMPLEAYTPPKTDDERARFAAFAAAAVERYGPGGSFWATCDCPVLPAVVWEVWNEPNIAPFWDLPSPAQYGALLQHTAAALRAADPAVRVLFGGLAYPSTLSSTRLEPNAFLEAVIAAVGDDDFDALALHNYRPNPERAVNAFIKGTVETLKSVVGTTADGAPRKQVWLNEFGRPTVPDDPATPDDELASSEQDQRAWLETFLGLLLPHRSDWNLGPVMWYSLRDAPLATESWERQGLRRTTSADADAGSKPSWELYIAHSAPAELLYLPGLYDLTVERIGDGDGAVTSSPAGIDCGDACSGAYAAGTVVTLTASPASGSRFTGWSGDCTGAAACTVTFSAARAVGANFEAEHPSPATPALAGASSVTSQPGPTAIAPNASDDRVAPAITRLALSPIAFRAARSGPALAAAIGTRLSLSLSESAQVSFGVARRAAGRRVAGRCRRASAHNAERPRCSRWIRLRGRVARSLAAGPHALRFRGRLSGRTLRPGRYRLVARARDSAGNLSGQRSTPFVVID